MQRAAKPWYRGIFAAGAAAAAVASASAHSLDVYVDEVMKQWAVPGLAVAVVKDG